ncbi:MAG: hypoxanthine phosphoribosyltransferase [Candidatus Eisenbacteria bacterium]|nr:hypoxanthine phosphoribosyltransferase [Candidatus Eisenbacteria bacterium]
MRLQLGKVLLTKEQIQERVEELGARISEDYGDDPPIFVNVLKGGVIFLADLVRATMIPCEIDFMEVSSYGNNTESSGVVRILEDLSLSITDRHVLIVEDIVDTGLTLHYIIENLETRHPKSIRICTLLDRRGRREVDLELDYVGFVVPDKFVIGYGLDLAQKYRNLPYIAVLEDEEIP